GAASSYATDYATDSAVFSQERGMADWKIYPNPTQSSFQILGAKPLELETVRLLNLTGTPLRSWDAAAVNGTLHLPDNLASGIYWVETTTVSGEVKYQKLVLAK
ncbi:MAG: T9SS type A sorting domain-containing protein, partial [Bacteroidota bacterium]